MNTKRKMPHSFTLLPCGPSWQTDVGWRGNRWQHPVCSAWSRKVTAMEKGHFRGSPAQSWSSAHSLFLWGCCRCQHVQAGACSVQMESLKYLADKLLNVLTKVVLIENFQRFIAWPNVGGFSKRWQKAHPQEQGHPFSKCYASVPKHILLN